MSDTSFKGNIATKSRVEVRHRTASVMGLGTTVTHALRSTDIDAEGRTASIFLASPSLSGVERERDANRAHGFITPCKQDLTARTSSLIHCGHKF